MAWEHKSQMTAPAVNGNKCCVAAKRLSYLRFLLRSAPNRSVLACVQRGTDFWRMDRFLDAIRDPEGGSRVDGRSLLINENAFAQHAFAI
jgi:hypothetical protein